MENTELVLKTIRDEGKPLKSKEIAEITGVDKKEIDKAIKKLKADEKLISPKACFYDVK